MEEGAKLGRSDGRPVGMDEEEGADKGISVLERTRTVCTLVIFFQQITDLFSLLIE